MRKKWKSICAVMLAAALTFSMIPASASEVQEVTGEEKQIVTNIDTVITQEKPETIAGENIAKNKSVTTNIATHADRPISAVTNGLRNSFAQPSSFGQITVDGDWYVTVDLGNNYSIETVVYGKADLTAEGYPESYKNNVKSYQIQISEDNRTWKELGKITTEQEVSKNDVYFIPQEKVTARYVRMYAPGAVAWNTIDELEVYSTDEPEQPEEKPIGFPNVALGGDASISEPLHTDHNSADLAIDGSLQTYVTANAGQPFDYMLAFPDEKVQFDTVVLRGWYNDYYQQDQRIRKLAISVSADGEEWNRIAEHELTAEELKTDFVLKLDEVVSTKYFKLEMLQADEWVAINELELYDTTTVPPVMSDTLSGSTLRKGEDVELHAYEGATIWYTDDGTNPKESGTAKEYTDPIVINGDTTIRAYAKKEGMNDSPIMDFIYYMQYIDADPMPGMIEKGTEVSLICHMKDAKVIYTTDGSDPMTSTTAKTYEKPIRIDEYTELQAYCENEKKTSPVYMFTYATENSALHAKVSASTSADGHGPEAAIDENPDTYWQPTGTSGEWLMFDMGAPFDFANLKIDWLDEDAAYQYVVETSPDGVAWHNYYIQKNGTVNERKHLIPNLETHKQYLRIRVLGSGAGKGIGIREIEILGKNSAKAADVPTYDDPATDILDRPVVNPIPDNVEGIENPVISLDGEWKFATLPQNGFWKNNTDISNWYDAKVPGELDAQGIPVYYPDNPDWYGNYGNAPFYPGNNLEMAYKRQIDVPADFEGQKVFLRIDKAFSYARVWVNGQYVREHRGEYNSWDADITDYIIPGQKNWITISVTAEGGANGEEWGFIGLRSFRGILGSVKMYATPENHLNRLHYKTDLDENYEDATLTVTGNAFLEEGKTGEVEFCLRDKNGKELKLENNTLAIDQNFTDCSVSVPVKNPDKWDSEHPDLYEVTADFKVDGKVVETITQKIGFREIEVKVGDDGYKKFMVNGVSTKLRGVNYHTVYGNDGPSYDLKTERKLLEKIKEMNVNFIRASHYPMSTESLELCDELGIYVEQENSITFAGMFGFKTTINENPIYKDYIVGTAAEMVEKDMSHPSIVMWSLGNESFWGANHKAAAQYVRAMNTGIPTIFSYGKLMAPPDYPVDEHEETDIFSSHYLDAESEYNYFDKPILWDEYAHNYMGNEGQIQVDPGIRDDYYNIIRHNWEKMYNHPQRIGGAIWDFTDNVTEGKTHVLGNGNWGMLDVWGNEKPEFWATKAVYAPPQYKGETYVSLLSENKALELTYENRYETVSFDDEDFEIIYYINGEKAGNIKSDLSPKESGVLKVPAPENGWKLGDKIRIEFYKTTSTFEEDIRRIVVADEVIIGKPNYTVADSEKEAPEIEETTDGISVKGEDFQIDFSKETGMITKGAYKGETVLTGGPYLSNNLGNQGEWTQKSIVAETKDNQVVVTIDGAYGNMGCTFILNIDGDGKIETTYSLQNGAFSTLEIGVAYDLPATTETMSWIREGYTNDYTETQANREQGIAFKETEWKREWAVEPPEDKGWKDYDKDFFSFGRGDQGGRGTTDFRSSKTGLYYAEIGYKDSETVLSVYGGEGKGSVRAVMNADKTVRLNINTEWGYPVTQNLSNAPARSVNVSENHSDTVVMKLSDVKNNYEVEYTPIKENPFIKITGVQAGSSWPGSVKPENIINNSGMSGTDSFEDTHNAPADGSSIWHTDGNQGNDATDAWVQLDLGMVYQLDEMWIWNLNQPNDMRKRGFKNVKIEYSEDGKNWNTLEKPKDMQFEDGDAEYMFQFAQADGVEGQKATNLNDGNNSPVSFNGVKARYVKITAKPVPGEGSWGIEPYMGLSEVRFTQMSEAPETPVNKTILRKTYDYALTLDTDGVTDSAKKFFEDALANAKAVLDKEDATQKEVDAAWSQLVEGIHRLGIVRGDKTMLKLLIDQAEVMLTEKDRYVEENWQQLVEALTEARDVYESGDSTQDMIDEATDTLLNAILAQRYKANKENLQDIIDQAEGLDLSKYTKESVKVFKDALANAKEVLADESLSIDDQKKVDKAAEDLKKAIKGLKLVSNDGTHTGKDQNNGNADKDVPKTGDEMPFTLFLGIALSLAVISCSLQRKKRKE